jgi:hypothetical protein
MNPSISTTARGRLTLRFRYEAKTIDYELTYSAVEGQTVSAAHIHFARQRMTGGVMAALCGDDGKEPCPLLEGTVRGRITAADIAARDAATLQGLDTFEEVVGALQASALYADVHSDSFPEGEIRGQLFEISRRDD